MNRSNFKRTFKSTDFLRAPFWLFAVAIGMIAIHLTLVWRTDSPNFQVASLVFWSAAAYQVWRKRDRLSLDTDIVSSVLGAAILILLLLKSTAISGGHFLRFYPFVAGIGLSLLASGILGIRQYGQALILLIFPGIPEVLLPLLVNPSELAARFATALLWYSGFNVTRQGIHIFLPGGSIEVYAGCSGLESMTQLLGLSVLFLIVLPLRWSWIQKLRLPLLAIAIGFVVNGIRVALMALLVAQGQATAFEYWHTGQGSLIFSGIAALLFVVLVNWLVQIGLAAKANKESQA